MKLTEGQRAILEGSKGPIHAEYLKRLVDWGDAFGASRLIPVENVMVNGVSVPNHTLGPVGDELIDSYVEYVESCLSEPVAITTCCQASCMDLVRPHSYGADERQAKSQYQIMETAKQSGIPMTFTCAPYLVGNVPVKGQICAWTESHAVIYINSILGARTTRHGNESTTAAMVTGWVPEFGVLLTENRKARFQVDVKTSLESDTDWGCLGYFAGKAGALRIPVFTGLKSPRLESARQLSAAMATSGGAPMFHIAGVTPEAPTLQAALQNQDPEEVVTFGRSELASVYESFAAEPGSAVDFVYFGCPHATLQEIVELAAGFRGKRIHENVLALVSVSYALEMQARRLGFAEDLEQAGVSIMADTCPTNNLWPRNKTLMATPSLKSCFYARNLLECDTVLASPADCIRIAQTGRLPG